MIKDVSIFEVERPRTKSQTITDADIKNKGKGKLDEPPAPKLTNIIIDHLMTVNYNFDDINVKKEELMETTKKRKRIHDSKDVEITKASI